VGGSPVGYVILVTRLGALTATSEQLLDYSLISAIYYSEPLLESISLAVAL
jgi:hypothetical protein